MNNYTYPVCPVAPATTTVGTSSAIAGFDVVVSKVARAAVVVVVDLVKKSRREEVAAASLLFSEAYRDSEVDTDDTRVLRGAGARNAVD